MQNVIGLFHTPLPLRRCCSDPAPAQENLQTVTQTRVLTVPMIYYHEIIAMENVIYC